MDDLSQLLGPEFDLNEVPPMDDFIPVPPGNYTCQIAGAEIKETKSRTGHGLTFSLTVLDGPHAGRKVFDFINIANPSQVCQKMGRSVFAALSKACGIVKQRNESFPVAELNGKVVVAHVKVKDDRNNVRTYSAPGAAAPIPVAAPVPVAPQHPCPSPVMAPVAPITFVAPVPTHARSPEAALPGVSPVAAPMAPAVPAAASVYQQPVGPAPAPSQPLPGAPPPAPITSGPPVYQPPLDPTVAVLPQQSKPWAQDEIPF